VDLPTPPGEGVGQLEKMTTTVNPCQQKRVPLGGSGLASKGTVGLEEGGLVELSLDRRTKIMTTGLGGRSGPSPRVN